MLVNIGSHEAKNVESYEPANVEIHELEKVFMQYEAVFVEAGADFGEEDDKGETPLQFDKEDKGKPQLRKGRKYKHKD